MCLTIPERIVLVYKMRRKRIKGVSILKYEDELFTGGRGWMKRGEDE